MTGIDGSQAGRWSGMARRIHMCEVGPRDGLQMEAAFVSTEDKIALVDALSACGLSKIEVTAFVSPQAIPALRDAEIVLREVARRPGCQYTALVPNVRGAERAIESRVDEMNLVMSASATHNLANLRMTQDQSFDALAQVARVAREARTPVNVSLSCVFGCPFEGDIAPQAVFDWVARFADIGVTNVTLCDTTGMAFPPQVFELVRSAIGRWPGHEFTLHFHNTRGIGLANALAGIDAGAHRLDASLGGLGGCPYAPGASGNVCSEELVHALALMGYDTGVDLEALLAAARRLPALVGHDVPSQLIKSDHRLHLHPVPADFEAIRSRALARPMARV